LSEEKKSPQKQPRSHFGALLLATVVSVIGACAMAASVVIQNSTRRFPSNGNFPNFNVTRPFNATRTFSGQFVAQRVPTSFGYASWLTVLGLACLVVVAIILVVLLFQSRSGSTPRTGTKA
jgi:hypothetical protein